MQGDEDFGSALEIKVFVVSRLFADQFPRFAHNQDERFQTSGARAGAVAWRIEGVPSPGGVNSLFIRF
jgi:hypothetical protein